MSSKEVIGIDELDLEIDEATEVSEKEPSVKELKKIEKLYKDILVDDTGLEIEADNSESENVARLWKYIEKTRRIKKDEKDIMKISSREYVEVDRDDERVEALNCDFDRNAGFHLSRLDEDLFG